MKKKKLPEPVVLKDSKHLRNVIIQIDMKQGKTFVLSGFSAWENLALLMEALSVTAEQCMAEGIKKQEVYRAIKDYMVKSIGSYELVEKKKGD